MNHKRKRPPHQRARGLVKSWKKQGNNKPDSLVESEKRARENERLSRKGRVE